MFQELSTSLKASLYERVSSPLVGSIVFSWVAFNWKGLAYLLLSDSKIEEKIKFFSDNYSNVDTNIWFPLLSGTAIAVFYPLIAYIPFWIWEQIQSAQRNLKKRLSLNELLSVEQSLQLRNELAQKDSRIREVIAENQASAKELKGRIEELTKENSSLYFKLSEISPPDPKADPTKVDLAEVEYKILNEHTGLEKGYSQYIGGIAHSLMLPDAEVERAMERLVHIGFIKANGTVEDENGLETTGYVLDELGRKYLGYLKADMVAAKA
ncbi:hypothetical protein [Vibrio owensii]|uniref:hypothetical protein n=1 Tax=Vibrio owensii TaxID=696485 RepID=UPI003DA0BDEB